MEDQIIAAAEEDRKENNQFIAPVEEEAEAPVVSAAIMGSLAEMARELDMAEESSSEEEKVVQKAKPVIPVVDDQLQLDELQDEVSNLVGVPEREENKVVIQKDDALADYEDLLGGSIDSAGPEEPAAEHAPATSVE